jgi:putative mycofactocin binding protein MftB
VGFDPGVPYRLHPKVALRPEPFGALAYHYGNRRLVFLKSPRLVGVVRSLGEHATVAEALDAAGVGGRARGRYLDALGGLAASDMIEVRA